MNPNAPLIEARALTRHYGRTTAVQDLSLSLHKGEILGLLGPNGAGKSTTMKMLTGTLSPSAGEVRIEGLSLREAPKRAKQALGYLPEQPPVYPELTVDEYLHYCASLHGIPARARAEAVAHAQRDCGLTEVGQRLIGNLSKGYQQRVGLAQAIIHRPPVIILDEPTVGLDPIQIREIRGLIAELGRNHSVILSSHILPEIQAVCSRVMIVNRGRCVYDAAIDAHLSQRLLVRLRDPAEPALFTAVAGVTTVEVLDQGRYRLEVAEGADPRAALASALVSRGLLELREDRRSLEDIFVELTSGDAAALKEAA
ncbi:MAG TPA: ABC transporter ATP-binding protein [Nevskiaceae bacterium]|nr:ABC transporter ATP-binding protein [Nevskiaceae bacterium]